MRLARRLSRFQFYARLPLVALVACLAPGHANDRVAVLRRLVPDVDAGLISHLVDDDARQLLRYANRIPVAVLGATALSLDAKLWSAAPDRYVRVLEFIGPYDLRLAETVSRRTGLPEEEHDIRYRLALGAGGIELNRHVRQVHRLQLELTIRPGGKVRGYRVLIAAFERLGYERGVIQALGSLADDLARLGDR